MRTDRPQMKPQRLTGKSALITDGAVGIGAAKLITGYIVPLSRGRKCHYNIIARLVGHSARLNAHQQL